MDDAENAAPEERVTVADVRLSVDSRNVMQHFADGELSNHATIALYGLAHGLTHDWWSIFGGRDREFSLLNYRSGYLLPDVRFWFDGSAFDVEVQEKSYREPDLRFWGGMRETLTRAEGEAALAAMIETILGRLKTKGIKDTSAQLRWKRVQHSRKSGEQSFCETAGGLGLDPYAIEDEAADFIERAEQIFEPEPLMEFAAGARDAKPAPLLDWVDRMRGYRGFKYRLADLAPMARQVERDAPQKAGEAAWAVGYRRARKMREALCLTQADRLTSYKRLADKLGGGASYNIAGHVDGIKALRSEREDGVQIHLRSQGQNGDAQLGHLFALARAVGDAVCFPESDLAPINDAHHAYRQAAGRAFAAELLAPVDEIRSMRRDRHDLVTIASSLSVSKAVIEHQLENGSRIDAACSEG